METDVPALPGWLRLVLVLALVTIGSGVVMGVTDGLRTAVHGGAKLVQASR